MIAEMPTVIPSTRKLSNVTKSLMAARSLLINYGWCQHEYHEVDGTFCAVGAIYEACQNSEVSTLETVEMFLDANGLGRHPIREIPVTAWNDDPARTKEEVLEAFDKAVDRSMQCQD